MQMRKSLRRAREARRSLKRARASEVAASRKSTEGFFSFLAIKQVILTWHKPKPA